MKLSLDERSTFSGNIAFSHIKELISARSFLRNACQHDVRHFCALNLPYLYCYVFLLLKRPFALNVRHNDYPRMQKVLMNEHLLI